MFEVASRIEFSGGQVLVLSNLLPKLLKDRIVAALDTCSWKQKIHEGISEELVISDPAPPFALDFWFNTAAALGAIEGITGTASLTRFVGRIYRMDPDPDHFDTWHTDTAASRAVGMSLNLSRRPFEGGEFCLRRRGTDKELARVHNVRFGDALIFPLSREFEHRVNDVRGGEPKIAYAGWYLTNARTIFQDLLRSEA